MWHSLGWPWSLCWLLQILYEWSMAFNTTVVIAYWVIELPFMGYWGGFYGNMTPVIWICYYIVHTLP